VRFPSGLKGGTIAWVEPNSPEGYLQRAQEHYDRVWDDWFHSRSQADTQRLEQAEADLNWARKNVESNNAAKRFTI
jgi:hypothetical protein